MFKSNKCVITMKFVSVTRFTIFSGIKNVDQVSRNGVRSQYTVHRKLCDNALPISSYCRGHRLMLDNSCTNHFGKNSFEYYHDGKHKIRHLTSFAKPYLVEDESSNTESNLQNLEKETQDLLESISSNTKGCKNITMMHVDDVMNSWSRQNSFHSAQRAEDLLVALERNYDKLEQAYIERKQPQQHNPSLVPSLFSYNYVLQAYAQSEGGGERAALKSEEILMRMIDRWQRNELLVTNRSLLSQPPKPPVSSFHHVMNAWANSNTSHAGQKAEEIYTLLEYTFHDNDKYPNAQSLAIVFDAWANSFHKESVNRVITTLYHVIDKERETMKRNRGKLLCVNNVVFHSVLLALINSKEDSMYIASKGEEIFNLLQNLHEYNFYDEENDGNIDNSDLKPNIRTWSLLIRCWANAVNKNDDDGGEYAANKAETLLNVMVDLYKNGNDLRPNSYCFSTCIHAWSKCRSKQGAYRAIAILENKEAIYEATGDEDLKPNIYEYNVCLVALCNSDDADYLQQARQLFLKMQKLKIVDTVTFNTIIAAYAKSRDNERQRYMSEFLKTMNQLGIDPDIVTYNTVMDAMAKNNPDSDTVKIVQNMLQTLINVRPDELNVRSFATVLSAIAKSQVHEKIETARIVFRQLIDLYEKTNRESLKPDVKVWGAFLSCCANHNGSFESKRQALKLALGAYEQLCSRPDYGEPNEYIYRALLKGSIRLSHDDQEKHRLLERIFIKCRSEGFVCLSILNMLLKHLPINMRKKLMEDCVDVNTTSIKVPSSWCRNVARVNRPLTII